MSELQAEGVTSADAGALHQALIDALIDAGHIRSPAVEAAFRAVPRHRFLPGLPIERVYRDEAIPTHERDGVPISSSSQPAAMAIMLEQLDVRPGQRVLEIGAGTGYNAALLARLVGPDGRVVTVDLDEPIVEEARAHLAAAGIRGVEVVRADGGGGFPSAAPYDRIELTVGAWDVAPAWREQLAPGGRLVVPLWLGGAQLTVALEPALDAAGLPHLASVNISGCAFMRLRGAFAGPEGYVALGDDAGVTIGVDDRARVDPERVWRLLNGPGREVELPPLGRGFGFWLGLREPGYCQVSAEAAATVPIARRFPIVAPGHRATDGLLGNDALCLRVLPEDLDAAGPDPPPTLLRCLGDAAEGGALAGRYRAQLAAWIDAGQPAFAGVHLRVYPLDAGEPDPPPAVLIPKRWNRLALDWSAPVPHEPDDAQRTPT